MNLLYRVVFVWMVLVTGVSVVPSQRVGTGFHLSRSYGPGTMTRGWGCQRSPHVELNARMHA